MQQTWTLKALKGLTLYIILICAFFFISERGFRYQPTSSELHAPEAILDELSEGTTVTQTFISSVDTLEKLTIYMNTFGRQNEGILTLSLIDDIDNRILSSLEMNASLLEGDGLYEWVLDSPIENANAKQLSLTVTSTCPVGKAPSIYGFYGSTNGFYMNANGNDYGIALCISHSGTVPTWFSSHYWPVAGIVLCTIVVYFFWTAICLKHGRDSKLSLYEKVWQRYKFLVHQLVSRDFKTKYKRSILGYLWSFLNPLFTMAVQYIVFSTIFRSDIKNFPVYLLSGIILFSFFTDSVGQGLGAIVTNSALITKVYVPKYIYPITKVISSAINLLISLIPLIIICLLTKAPITPALLLLPFVIVCLILFSIGMSLFLSAAMVFFRDTQYLWGIISLAWMYATPLFYPENIIPEQFILIQKLNPLYYMIKFARILMIEGISPPPYLYACCAVSALAALALGGIVFKKTQDRFVLYI